jgi:hypothetical protein
VTADKPAGSAASWGAFGLFYLLMLIIIALLDWVNNLMRPSYFLAQVGLLTLGVGIFALVGWRLPRLRAEHGALLAFTIGVLTIVPAILMSLGQMIEGFWSQYFLVAFGMASGSLLAFLFARLAARAASRRKN